MHVNKVFKFELYFKTLLLLETSFVLFHAKRFRWLFKQSPRCNSTSTLWAWWLIGINLTPFVRRVAGSNPALVRHVGTLGKSFTHSCLWRFGVKLGIALLSRAYSSELEEPLWK